MIGGDEGKWGREGDMERERKEGGGRVKKGRSE